MIRLNNWAVIIDFNIGTRLRTDIVLYTGNAHMFGHKHTMSINARVTGNERKVKKYM